MLIGIKNCYPIEWRAGRAISRYRNLPTKWRAGSGLIDPRSPLPKSLVLGEP